MALGGSMFMSGTQTPTQSVPQASAPKKTYSEQFETAVTVIKKYEGLHRNKGELIGYGHKVLATDKYKRGANLTEAQADQLLRDDLEKLCAKYRDFGQDSLLLSALAYNCGIGVVAKSNVYKRLLEGNRDIKDSYLAHARYRGKVLSQLQRRRAEEYELLFIPDEAATLADATDQPVAKIGSLVAEVIGSLTEGKEELL